MSKPLPTRRLPAKPDLAQLKRQAKELLQAYRTVTQTPSPKD